MRNSYLSALFEEVDGGKTASGEESSQGKDAHARSKTAVEDEPAEDEHAAKVAQANREDLEGRVSARVYLQSLSKLGIHVPPRVELTDAQVKAACEGASLAVRAVVKRRAAT